MDEKYISKELHDAQIAELKAEIKSLDEAMCIVYDGLNKRIDDLQTSYSDRLTIYGIIVAVIIGVTQIIIALLK